MTEKKTPETSTSSTGDSKTRSPRDATAAKPAPDPFTLEHFKRYAELVVYDDGEQRELDPWQVAVAEDVFAGVREVWLIVPEGNGKSTFVALLALYGADYSRAPWIPVGASSAKQARIVYDQASGFVERTDGLEKRFRCFGGYKLIRSLRNGGIGIEVFAADVGTGDGVIPYPFAILDELHRHKDMRLYGLWRGKLRKRRAQLLGVSTAGEPETPFENLRDEVRRKATDRHRVGSYLRAKGKGLVLHEFMVPKDDLCTDMEAVKAANPRTGITVESLTEDFDSPTTNLGDWKRLKCNRPVRSAETAITDAEWDGMGVDAKQWRDGARVDVGLDVAWKWDTTAFVPLLKTKEYRLLGPTTVIVPPRDGSMIHPDDMKYAFNEVAERNPVDTVVMDMSKAEDIAAWIEEQGVTVVDRQQTNQYAVADYEAFMDGVRNGTLKHIGDLDLRRHALNAVARRLPGGDHRFDRPVRGRVATQEQDRRVIDALTAAAMVVELSGNAPAATTSVYANRDLAVA